MPSLSPADDSPRGESKATQPSFSSLFSLWFSSSRFSKPVTLLDAILFFFSSSSSFFPLNAHLALSFLSLSLSLLPVFVPCSLMAAGGLISSRNFGSVLPSGNHLQIIFLLIVVFDVKFLWFTTQMHCFEAWVFLLSCVCVCMCIYCFELGMHERLQRKAWFFILFYF